MGGVALWFVPVFYFSIMLTRLLSDRCLVTGFFAAMVIAYLIAYYKVELPWTLSTVPFATGLMFIVRRYSGQIKKRISKLNTHKCVLIVITAFALGMAGSQFYRLDLAWNNILPLIPKLILLALGVICIILFSVLVVRYRPICKIFTPIGNNTFEIMSLSQISIALTALLGCDILIRYTVMILIIVAAVYIKKFIQTLYANLVHIKYCS